MESRLPNLCHIGHGRTFVAFDVVARYLRFLGYKLKYVRNITDIDNKIIKRANENGESFCGAGGSRDRPKCTKILMR